jgi:hypothetical protein
VRAAGAREVELSARVDRAEIAQGEHVILEVRVEAPEAPTRTHVPDDTADFHVVGTATAEEGAVSLGGGPGARSRQAFVGRIELAPRHAGDLSTPEVQVTVRGRVYVTPSIKVRVRAAGASPPAAARPPTPAEEAPRRPLYRGWERDLVLQVELDRGEVFQGEQVVASIWLYSPVGVVDLSRYDPPRFDGFWAETLELAQTLRFQTRLVNGLPSHAYLLQRLALFPTRAGALTLEPALVQARVRLGGGGPLDALADVVPVERRSKPVTLNVKPLPPGAPAGFQPANVGGLELVATAAPERGVAGEPISIRLTASGDGNVRALALPALPAVPGARAYPPTESDASSVQGGRFGGAHTVETVLVPEHAGLLEVPALAWPYFDPRSGRYEVARTEALRVPIDAAAAAPGPAAPGTNALAAGLRPIRAEGALARRAAPWRGLPFSLLLGVPPLLLAALVLSQRLRAAASAPGAPRAAERGARRRLAAARRRLSGGDGPGFVGEVERALSGYAAQRLGRPAAGLTRDALLDALARAGAHPTAIRALAAALDQVDLARYGGGDGGPALLAAAERAVRLLEEADWTRSTPGAL